MAEEVKIVIRQESQGSAVRDAERDLDRLQRTSKVDWAGLQRQREQATKAISSGGGAANPDKGKSEAALTREIALSTELEAAQLRVAGDTTGAARLEREAEVLRRSVGIQQQLGVSSAEAATFAQTQLASEEKLAQAAAATAAEKKAAAAAARIEAAETAAAARAGARETRGIGAAVGRSSGIGGGLGRGLLNPEFLIAAAATALVTEMVSQAVARRDEVAAEHGKEIASANRRAIISAKSGLEGEEDRRALERAFAQSVDLFIRHYGIDPTAGDSAHARSCRPQSCP